MCSLPYFRLKNILTLSLLMTFSSHFITEWLFSYFQYGDEEGTKRDVYGPAVPFGLQNKPSTSGRRDFDVEVPVDDDTCGRYNEGDNNEAFGEVFFPIVLNFYNLLLAYTTKYFWIRLSIQHLVLFFQAPYHPGSRKRMQTMIIRNDCCVWRRSKPAGFSLNF